MGVPSLASVVKIRASIALANLDFDGSKLILCTHTEKYVARTLMNRAEHVGKYHPTAVRVFTSLTHEVESRQ